MEYRIRKAMLKDDVGKLAGIIEADECDIGGKPRGCTERERERERGAT